MKVVWILTSLLWIVHGEVIKKKLSDRVVTTRYGKLRGLAIEMPSTYLKPVEAFLGLQYASTLGKELRFLPPTSPMENWSGIRVAISHRPVCPQKMPDLATLNRTVPRSRVERIKRIMPFIREQREDCLSLNIYMPKGSNASVKTGFPVVVFIHGETYDIGTGNAYDGSILASYGQLMVVTLNYRLGAFGFLSTGDHNAPGNYALMDIVAALQWLKENVAAFGGDAGNMSLMGHGHGAALVNLLMLSPVTAGGFLFKRAIVMSGSALSSWAITDNPRYYTHQLAKRLKCDQYIEDSPKLLGCFRDKSLQLLVNVSQEIRAPKYRSSFGPIIHESSVLPRDVRRLIMKGKWKCPLLIGNVKNEGYDYLSELQVQGGISDLDQQRLYRTYVNNVYSYHRQRIYDIIQHQYTDWDDERTATNIRDGVMAMLGDSQKNAPAIELVKLYALVSKVDTYTYVFAAPSHGTEIDGAPGDDLAFVFGAPVASGVHPFPSAYTRNDRMLSESVMRYWSNFIKSGDPNSPDRPNQWYTSLHVKNKFAHLIFPTYDLKSQSYMYIAPRPSVRKRYRARQVALWLNLIPKLHQPNQSPGDVEHLLEEHDNSTLFLQYTRDVDLHMVLPPPPLTTPKPTQKPHQARTIEEVVTISPRFYETRTEKPPKSTGIITADTPVALGIIIVVGAALLFLNVLVFAVVYYQRDRRRRSNKDRALNHEETVNLDQVESTETPYMPQHETPNHLPINHIKTNSHLLQPNGGVSPGRNSPRDRNYESTGKHCTFSATIWTYNADSDTKEPVTVV